MNRLVLQKITRVYRFGIPRNTWVREKSTSDHFLAYKLFGSTVHEYDGTLYRFGKDDIIVANCDDFYRVTQNEFSADGRKGSCIAVHFTTAEPFDWHFSMFACAGHPQIRSAFFKMLDAWNRYTAGCAEAEYSCLSEFYKICAFLNEMQNGQIGEEDGRLENARAFLERNSSDSALTVADAADTAGLGQRRFTELFAGKYHKTPGRYLTEYRIRQATELLCRPQLTVAEIALLCGFTDSGYFIRVFRKQTGVPPGVYRKRFR